MLTDVDDGTYDAPSWSPDGARLVFEGVIGYGDRDLYRIEADGDGLELLTDNETYDGNPSWRP